MKFFSTIFSKEWWITLLGPTKWTFAATSAITYFLASYMDDKDPWTSRVWRLSAISGLLAFICETAIARRDRKESEQLRGKVAELNLRAEQERHARVILEIQLADARSRMPRQFTDGAMNEIKRLLDSYPKQEFLIFVNPDDHEASLLDEQFRSVLHGAKHRIDPMYPMRGSSDYRALPPGIGVASGPNASDEIARRLIAIFKSDGMTVCDPPVRLVADAIPEGTIEIIFGPRPPNPAPPQPPPQMPP